MLLKKSNKFIFAFSLIELMVSLITISCIAAAFSPIISKKLSMSSIMVSKPSGGSEGDSSGSCPSGQYMPSGTNTCTKCSDTFSGCSICTESECLVCNSGFNLFNGQCELNSCPANTIKITTNGKDLCVTQYNMGDRSEFPVNISNVSVVSVGTSCTADACCWQGKTSESCDSENGGYSGCNRTVCTYYAAEKICNNLNYGGMGWRLPTKDELAGFDPTTNSKYKGTSGLMLCDDDSGYGSAQCADYYNCDTNYYECSSNHIWCVQTIQPSNWKTSTYAMGSGSWSSWSSTGTRYAYSVRCVSNLTCATKFNSNCLDCSDTTCTVCKKGYVVNKNGQCIADPCPENTVYVEADGKELCVTQYNMGDKTEFPVNVSGVSVVSTGTNCSANACCWQGRTSNYCNSDNGDYSGCNRTLCTQYAAEIICNNLNYGGLTWRLPTKDELAGFYPTYSKDLGTSGLMLCDYYSGYGSARCDDYDVCDGSYDGNCYPYYVWSSALNSSFNAYLYCLHARSWGLNSFNRREANSVRCVSNIACTKFGSNCTDCSDSACTACKEGYAVKNSQCVACSSAFGSGCTSCSSSACTACSDGHILKDGKCIVSPCPTNTVYVAAGNKELCVTQYNMGDKTEFPVNVSGVSVVSTNSNCNANACCWQGTTASPCNSINGDYSGCNRTLCTQYAAEKICNNLNYGGMSWRLPTKDELKGFDPGSYSINKGTSGLMLCDYGSGYGSAYCHGCYVCNGSSSGSCSPDRIWCSTLYSSSSAYNYYLYSGSWTQDQYERRHAFSVRCVSPLSEKTCKDTFGNGCVECSSSACTRCVDGYNLKDGQCVACSSAFGINCTSCSSSACTICKEGYGIKDGQCVTCSDAFGAGCTSCSSSACNICSSGYTLKNGKCVVVPTCPANTVKITVSGKDLCVTQYNMGDKTEFPVNVSGVSVVSTNSYCGADACCWQGRTANNSCNSNNGDYSGCKRTVCTQYAAEIICNNLNYGGMSWRLPTEDELAGFDPDTYSRYKGASGLMLCDELSGYGSAECYKCSACAGSDNGNCEPYHVWSSTLYSSSSAYEYFLGYGSWNSNHGNKRYASSVRCVSEL